jgi:cell division protein FtsQ
MTGELLMARKQAKRRRPEKAKKFRMPTIPVASVVTVLIASAVILVTYHVSGRLLDRPIQSVEIRGPFQRVTALHLEEAISDELDAGFLGASVRRMQAQIEDLPWIDGASVARRWPDRISIVVSEQVPAAIWGEKGLLNVRGELFISEARHIPAELPRLSGPRESADEVARRYLQVRSQLIPVGLDLRSVHLDARGAWEMTLGNGVEVRLGRREIGGRTSLFLDVVAEIVAGRAAEIDFIDMRYSNGFTIGWKDGASSPDVESQGKDSAMLALRGEP